MVILGEIAISKIARSPSTQIFNLVFVYVTSCQGGCPLESPSRQQTHVLKIVHCLAYTEIIIA